MARLVFPSLTILTFIALSGCHEDVLRVPGDCTTIQRCIDRASEGGLVSVEAGTYAENLVFTGRALHLVGVEGPQQTIIDGGYGERVVVIHEGEGPDTVLEGFTLTHGGDAALGRDGGGLYIRASSPTLTDLVIADNIAGDDGGGVYIAGDASPLLTRVHVTGNSAVFDGGGICIKDGASPTLEQGIVTGNSGGDDGGGIHSEGSTVTLRNVLLADNHAGFGGGMSIDASQDTLENVRMTGNDTTMDGGGVRLSGGAQATVTNGIFAGNSSGDDGGGVRLSALSMLTLTNVTIVGNDAGDGGGGIDLRDASLTMTNAILAGNTAGLDGGGMAIADDVVDVDVSYTIAWGNLPDDYLGQDLSTLESNQALDPQLLATDDADPTLWDLHLGSVSEAIDAGDPGVTDPDSSVCDPGAYGGPGAASWDLDWDGFPEWWLPGAYDYSTSPEMDCDDQDEEATPTTCQAG